MTLPQWLCHCQGGLGQNLKFVIAWLSLCCPGCGILSLPSMVAKDWSLRPPPIKVSLLYKFSLYRTGQGLEHPRLLSTSLHSIAAGIIAETTYWKGFFDIISPVLISLAEGPNPWKVHIQSWPGIEPWGYLSKDLTFHIFPRLFVHDLDGIFYQ